MNAIPTSDPLVHSTGYRRSLRLRADILLTVSDNDGGELENASRLWPITLRGRFAQALRPHKRKQWPHPPFPLRGLVALVRDLSDERILCGVASGRN
jgi:hypothetical protein